MFGLKNKEKWVIFAVAVARHNFKWIKIQINTYSAGIDNKRQILTSKVDSRTIKVKILIITINP